MSHNRVSVSAWFKISDGCTIEYSTCANEAEFTLGGRIDGFDFVATEGALAQLLAVGTEALRELREFDSGVGDHAEIPSA